jgi:RNA polymerase sigma-70 factor (ECF subfamily)
MTAANEAKPALRGSPEVNKLILEDDNLIHRAQNGSVIAIRELYLSHHLQIFRFVWSRVYDPDLAEDLTGEVFVRMLANLSNYEDRSLPFRAWLYSIARNLVIDHFRKNSSRMTVSLNDITDEPMESESLEEQAEKTLNLKQVRQMLEQINPDEREVVQLRFLAGLSLKETAIATNQTIAAVKAQQHKGLLSLKAMITS